MSKIGPALTIINFFQKGAFLSSLI